jgi:heavy metal sensor kinase
MSVRRVPVRLRLTLWFATLLAAALALVGVILVVGLRQRLYADFDDKLSSQAAITLATVQVRNGVPELATQAVEEQAGEYFLRLLDANGRVLVDNGSALGNVPLDRAAVSAALAGLTSIGSAAVGDNESLRIITLPVRRNGDAGDIVGVLQVGLDRQDLDDILNQFATSFALLAPLGLVVASGGGYFLAGRALAPVAAITDLAAGVEARDLHARLNLDLPNDELGRLARTFDAMLARIEDAFDRQRRFTGDAAHELRTPLSLMRSQIDLALARPRSAEDYREALRALDDDLERMTGLVAALLSLARADAGRLPIEPVPFDLAETVAATVEQFRGVAIEAQVELRDEAMPTPLVADEDLLVQALVNLIANAVAHTPPGGVVTVGCRRIETSVRLWVSDTGFGIPIEHQARVFDRFYRVDSGRTRASGGAGLGLAICQAIAEAHDGAVLLNSQPGRGTRVEVVVPAEPHGAASAPRASRRSPLDLVRRAAETPAARPASPPRR